MSSSDKFYSLFSGSYADYSSTKQIYLSRVNDFIKEESGVIRTMVDVGAGDGKRGRIIADSLNIDNFTAIESSAGMVNLAKNVPGLKVIKGDISSSKFYSEDKYDVVLCLWNVLGHIKIENRVNALINLKSLLNDNAFIFLDVNNQYNAVHYGLAPVIRNIFKDVFMPKKTNGDFELHMKTDQGEAINTTVHLFHPCEMKKLFKKAGLKINKRIIINYKTGELKKYFWSGHLVYKLSKIEK